MAYLGVIFHIGQGGEHTRVGLRGGWQLRCRLGEVWGWREWSGYLGGHPAPPSDARITGVHLPACQDIQADQISAAQPVAGDTTVSGST